MFKGREGGREETYQVPEEAIKIDSPVNGIQVNNKKTTRIHLGNPHDRHAYEGEKREAAEKYGYLADYRDTPVTEIGEAEHRSKDEEPPQWACLQRRDLLRDVAQK